MEKWTTQLSTPKRERGVSDPFLVRYLPPGVPTSPKPHRRTSAYPFYRLALLAVIYPFFIGLDRLDFCLIIFSFFSFPPDSVEALLKLRSTSQALPFSIPVWSGSPDQPLFFIKPCNPCTNPPHNPFTAPFCLIALTFFTFPLAPVHHPFLT